MGARTPDYYDGLRDGTRRYARWSPQHGDGRPATQVVGASETPLDDALARIDREQARATANGTVARAVPVAEVIEVIDLISGDADYATATALDEWRTALTREARS